MLCVFLTVNIKITVPIDIIFWMKTHQILPTKTKQKKQFQIIDIANIFKETDTRYYLVSIICNVKNQVINFTFC